jgi:hypothetical protein
MSILTDLNKNKRKLLAIAQPILTVTERSNKALVSNKRSSGEVIISRWRCNSCNITDRKISDAYEILIVHKIKCATQQDELKFILRIQFNIIMSKHYLDIMAIIF